MVDNLDPGPRLSDEDFFTQAIETERPGFAGLGEAVARRDWAAARQSFAAGARAGLQPARLLSLNRSFRGDSFMLPGETLAAAGERIVQRELISCGVAHHFADGVDWFSNHTHNQYREWTWQLSRHPEWAILAERYRQTGDERFVAAFVDFFSSWVRQAVVPEDAPGNETLCWRTIEAGIRMGGAWLWALHSFYRSPHFTDEVLVDWYKSVWEHGWRLRHFHRSHNWLIMEMNGLAQIALLYPQFREAAAWRAYAFERLVEELALQVYPDGFQFELTTNYHQVVIRNYQGLMDVYAAYDQPVPDLFAPALARMHEVNVRLVMPDGRLPDLNDGGWLPLSPLLARAVEVYPDRADFRWGYSGGQAGRPPDAASWAFPYAGYYVMRTDWDPTAIWALFDGGPFGFAHQHEDKLNLMIHAYGRLLLTEAGDYAYDTSEMRRYVLSTRGHNTIRVDGQDQNRRLNYERETIDQPTLLATLAEARWQSQATYDAVEAVYDEGYGPTAERNVSHRRRVIFWKSPPEPLRPCFLVIDRLTATDDQAHTYQILWHFDTAAAVRWVEGQAIVESQNEAGPNLTIMAAVRPGLTVNIVAGQEEPEWQGWKSTRHNSQGGNVPAPTADYRLTTPGDLRLVTLLYPTPLGESCPIVAVEATAAVEASNIQLILAGGASFTLDEKEFPL